MKLLVLNSEQDAKLKYGNSIKKEIDDVTYWETPPLFFLQKLTELVPDVILLSLEWLPQWRAIASQARRLNIPTIYVVDGVLEWSFIWENHSYIYPNGTNFQPVLSDRICVPGRSQARYLASLGLKEKIEVTGLPRLDNFKRTRTISRNSLRVLICTAKTAFLNQAHKIAVKSAIIDIKHKLEKYTELNIVWRLQDSLNEDLGIANSAHQDIEATLSEVDCVLSFSSTIILESMLKGIPTALIEYRNVPILTSTAWTIRSINDIENTLQELLHPPSEKMAYQDFCLDEQLEIGNASNRLRGVIETASIKNSKNGAPDTNKPSPEKPHFGALDFRQVHSQLSMFSESNVSLLQYELDATIKLNEQLSAEANSFITLLKETYTFKFYTIFYSIFSRPKKMEKILRFLKKT